MEIRRQGRHWGVYDAEGVLICLTVYRRGAAELVRRLNAGAASGHAADTVPPAGASAPARPKPPRRVRPATQRTATSGAEGSAAADRVAEDPTGPHCLGTITLRIAVCWEEHPP